jgi:hypothetical protein
VATSGGNDSLCHGTAGNCETLLVGARVLSQPGLWEVAAEYGDRGWNQYRRRGHWLSGTLGGAPDASLLMGDAGVGYFYLRLAAPATPSVLMLPGAVGEPRPPVGADVAADQRRSYVAAFFGTTLDALARIVGEDASPRNVDGSSTGRSDVEATASAIRAAIASVNDPSLRRRLRDAAKVDLARYRLSASADHSAEFLASLRRRPDATVDWAAVEIRLAANAEVVTTEEDWGAARGAQAPGGAGSSGGGAWLLHGTAGAIRVRRITPLAALVLGQARRGTTLAELTAVVSHAAGVSDVEASRRAVLEQLCSAYAVGLLDLDLALPDDRPGGRAGMSGVQTA